MIPSLLLLCAALLPTALAVPTLIPTSDLSSPNKRATCINTPATRGCWAAGYDISTDRTTSWPTGTVVTYNLDITNVTLAPDGIPRQVLAVNNQYPGPTIYANWGDIIVVHVKNKLTNNGTGIHWHGLRQLNSNIYDGVSGITECPIAPKDTKTYRFQATEYGTSWYHSHFSSQYGDGVLGAIVIAGPASANYDVDLGAYPITDWYYNTAPRLALIAAAGGPPRADNGLINGTMLSPDKTKGAYSVTTLVPGQKYRLRFINTSVDNHFRLSLDGHTFQVIASDFVTIVPYTTSSLFIGIGQRYDVIITANATIANYWFRAVVQTCSGANANNGNILSIFRYQGAPATNPTTTSSITTLSCLDESSLVPYVAKSVPSANFLAQSQALPVGFANGPNPVTGLGNVVLWKLNGQSFVIDWSHPSLQYVEAGNTSYSLDQGIIRLENANQFYFWIIQQNSTVNVPHPIHLHGHDFHILGSGIDLWDVSKVSSLNFVNPPRRDVAMLPSPGFGRNGGWLVIAFPADNPGVWLMHCHIAWHAGEGLAVQFFERSAEIEGAMQLDNVDSTCGPWGTFYATQQWGKDDSGI